MLDFGTILSRIKRSYRKNMPMLDAFRRGLFPDFVTDRRIKTIKHHVPVFTYHFVDPRRFETHLQFLSTNGYRTIGPDEFYGVMRGETPVPERTVLLTFDDGWKSLWKYGYPLLKKYGMQGVAFILPGMVPEGDACRPSLEDLWTGAVDSIDLQEQEKTAAPLCTWKEIQTMAESGVLNFQSHTMHHSQIFVSSRLVDFYHPSFDSHPANLDVPHFHDSRTGCNLARWPEWGMPLYEHEPRTSGRPRYYDDEVVRHACVNHVRKHGGAKFFKSGCWRRQLRRVMRKAQDLGPDRGHFEREEDTRQAVYDEVADSKKLIDAKLPGQRVTHICFPYYVGSELAVDASKKAGYVAAYWGFVEGLNENRPGGDPFRIARVDERFLLRLPGEGRKPLGSILAQDLASHSFRFLQRLRRSGYNFTESAQPQAQASDPIHSGTCRCTPSGTRTPQS